MPEEPSVSMENHQIAGFFTLNLNPDGSVTLDTTSRFAEWHAYATWYLLPPNCSDCIKIHINSWNPTSRVLDVDVTLKNPYIMIAYDVRGIVYTDDYGLTLLNDDAWTNLFDLPGGQDINPFKAFAKDINQRVFSPYTEHTENFKIYGPQMSLVRYAIDVSIGSNCPEPYSIEHFRQTELLPYTGAIAELRVDVLDWQNDVDLVEIYAEDITGEPVDYFSCESGNTWLLNITNDAGAPEGQYKALIKASSEIGPASFPLYKWVMITVGQVEVEFVFTSDRSGNFDIFRVDTESGIPYNITNTLYNEYSCDISSDSQFLYFNSDQTGETDVYSMNLNTFDIINITHDSEHDQYGCAVSPDGEWIVTVNSWSVGNKDIFRLKSDGSMLKSEWINLTNTWGEYEHEADWSPDGSKIAYYRIDGSGNDIWLMDSDDGANKEKIIATSGDDHGPKFSPDGNYILFFNQSGMQYYSFLDDQIHPYLDDQVGGSFSKYGQYVIYSSGTPSDIYYTEFPNAGTPVPLIVDPASDDRALWL